MTVPIRPPDPRVMKALAAYKKQGLNRLADMAGLSQGTGDAVQSFAMGATEPLASGEDVLAALRAAWKSKGVDLDAYKGRDGAITLSRIVVPKELRSQGIGSKAMQELSDLADKEKATLRLSPSTDFGGSSVQRLRDFYKRFGFVENKGHAKDFTTRETMYRNPKD